MSKQIPNWLFGTIIAGFTLGFIGLLGTAMKPAVSQGAPGATSDTVGQGPMVDKEAPDFSAKTPDGKTLRLADYKGKVVLVNFWATWCGPCRMEMPDLMKLQEELGPKGFTVIGLSGDDSLDTAAKFAKDQKLNYPIVLATPEMMIQFGSPQGIPASFLINKEGKIVWETVGVDPQRSMYSIIKPEIEKRL